MKPPSFLTAISQPHPHRTSLHSHMQSTAYHYNSILNAKSQLDTTKPTKKISLDILNNKRAKNLNKQRKHQNQKLLKTLIDIQRNYSLYGTKNSSELSSHQTKNSFNKAKRKSFDSRLQPPFDKTKTLKNPFIVKMQKLKISQQNLKLFEKISNVQSFANKKQMSRWDNRIKYLGSFLQSSRQKQCSQQLKNKFFTTFIKMRQTNNNNNNNLQSNTIRLQPRSLIINPQLRTLSSSKRVLNEGNQVSIKQSFRIKKEKRKNRRLRRIQTEGGIVQSQQMKCCYTEG